MIEFDDNVIEIIRKQDRTVSAANQTFFDSLPATEQRIFAAVSKHVQKFSSDGEKFVFDDGNVLLTNQVERIILDALQSSKYPSDVNGFLRNFETLKQYNFDIHRDVNDLSPEQLGELINPIQRGTVEQTLQSLTGSGVSTNFIEPIRTGIYQNIVAGSTKADLEAYLRRYILGNPDVDGLLSRYVKQVSRDALNQFDGQVNAKIASEFGLDAYRYVGSLIEDSRPQCRRWVAMGVIQTKDLPAEIAWMNANGTGAIPGTSPDTFSIYRGGYNCRHSAIPFKLTKSQRERLENPKTQEQIQEQIQQKQQQIQPVVSKPFQGVKTNAVRMDGAKYDWIEDDTNDILKLAGLPDDINGRAKIEYYVDPFNFKKLDRVYLKFDGDGVSIEREFDIRRKEVQNINFIIDNSSKYKGRGTEIFKNQVDELTKQEYKSIFTDAARGPNKNGFYTWARLGYLPDEFIGNEFVKKFNEEFKTDVKNFGELIGTKTGQNWWKRNGEGFRGTFDLTEKSYSQKTLNDYVRERGIQNNIPKKITQQIDEIETEIKEKKTSLKKLESTLFRSTQSKSINDEFEKIVENTNDVIEILNQRKTNVSLRTTKESDVSGTKKFLEKTFNSADDLIKQQFPMYKPTPGNFGFLPADANGCCATDNKYLVVKFDNGQKIDFRKYEINNDKNWLLNFAKKNNFREIDIDGTLVIVEEKNGKLYTVAKHINGKNIFHSISTYTRAVDKNIAPTITHELAHSIQNSKDNDLSIIKKIFLKYDFKKSDVPSLYAQTHVTELWTESLTSYVYTHDWLKITQPKVFQFVEEYLEAIGIDKNTIKIAQ